MGADVSSSRILRVRDLLAISPRKATRANAPFLSEAAGAAIQERGELAHKRQTILAANAALRERELIKLASLSAALAGALRQRGVTDPAASLTAEIAIAVFKIAFERWVHGTSPRTLPQLIRDSLDDLKAVTAAG